MEYIAKFLNETSICRRVSSYLSISLLLIIVILPNTVELNIQNKLFSFALLYCSLLATIILLLKNRIKLDLIDSLVGVLFIYLLIEYYIHDPYIAKTKFIHIIFLFSMYFGLRIIALSLDIKNLATTLLFFIGIIEAVIGILQFLGIIQSNHAIFAITGTFFNPGPYGGYLAIIASLAVCFINNDYYKCKGHGQPYVIIYQRNLQYKVTYFLAALSLVTILLVLPLTLSRTAFIAFLISLILYIINKKKEVFRVLSISKVIVLIISFFLFIVIIVFLYRLKLPSANGRLYIWGVSLDVIKANPWCGNGLSTFSSLFASAQEQFIQNSGSINLLKYADNIDYAFNEYIHMTSEIGFIGLIIFLLICGTTLYTYSKSDDIWGYGIIALLCFAFASYPLHLLPFQLLLTLFIAIRKPMQKFLLPRKLKYLYSLFIISIFLYSLFHFSEYFSKIKATESWLNNKNKIEIAGIDFRKPQELEEYNSLLNDNPRFLWDYGIFLLNTKKNIESIETLLQGAKLSGDPDFYTYVGINFEKLEMNEEAEKFYINAFRRLPNRIYPLYRLCLLYYKIQDKDKFTEYAKQIINFSPKVTSERTEFFKNDIIAILELEGISQ